MYNTLAKIFGVFDKTDIYLVLFTGLTVWFIFSLRSSASEVSWDHFWQNLDKFLLSFMFMFFFIVAVKQAGQVWIQDLVKQLMPAVLTLLGARTLQNRATDNKNAIVNQQTTTSSTITTQSTPVTNTTSGTLTTL